MGTLIEQLDLFEDILNRELCAKNGYCEDDLTIEQKGVLYGMKMIDEFVVQACLDATLEDMDDSWSIREQLEAEISHDAIKEVLFQLRSFMAGYIISCVDSNAVNGLYDKEGEVNDRLKN